MLQRRQSVLLCYRLLVINEVYIQWCGKLCSFDVSFFFHLKLVDGLM